MKLTSEIDRSLLKIAIAILGALLGAVVCPSLVGQVIEGRVPSECKLESSYRVEKNGTDGTLTLRVELVPGWHIFSTTQAPGGPIKTTITVVGSNAKLKGVPTPDREPVTYFDEAAFPGLPLEKYDDSVTWTVPIQFEAPVPAEGVELFIKINGQVCEESCKNVSVKKMKVAFAGMEGGVANMAPPNPDAIAPANPATDPNAPPVPSAVSPSKPLDTPSAMESQSGPFRAKNGKVEWKISIQPSEAKVGDRIELILEATPDPGLHIYRLEPGSESMDYRTTLVISEKSGLLWGLPIESSPWVEKLQAGTLTQYHPGPITWRVPIEIPSGFSLGDHPIKGLIGYTACTDTECYAPEALQFSGVLKVGSATSSAGTPLAVKQTTYAEVRNHPARRTWAGDVKSSEPSQPNAKTKAKAKPLNVAELLSYFGLSLIGGFALNFMPCVLPVIGLKILGFVQEGSGEPKRVALLNVWFVIGIMSVIMGMGLTIAIAKEFYETNIQWGSHFGNMEFRIGAMVLIFAMALSFLGVWEIPIPGFASGKTSGDLMSKEGFSGAFFKGCLTTILATPCTGPFMGGVLSLALTQPTWIILTMFFGLGFGLSFPYIVIACFPASMSWLPKPGAWTEKFKQVMAFPFLLTVVYFLTNFNNDHRIAALTMLIGVWFSCWLIGQVPVWDDFQKRAKVWVAAIAFAVIFGWGSFKWLGPVEHLIKWEPYSAAGLESAIASGKTVMIDFTAQWCPNCKTNLKFAIETKKVAEEVSKNNVAAFIVDMTDSTDEQWDLLETLNANSIPVLALYPPSNPKEPLVLMGPVLESDVLKAIKNASSSN